MRCLSCRLIKIHRKFTCAHLLCDKVSLIDLFIYFYLDVFPRRPRGRRDRVLRREPVRGRQGAAPVQHGRAQERLARHARDSQQARARSQGPQPRTHGDVHPQRVLQHDLLRLLLLGQAAAAREQRPHGRGGQEAQHGLRRRGPGINVQPSV